MYPPCFEDDYILHVECAECEQKEPRQEPVSQVLASYLSNKHHLAAYSSKQPLSHVEYQRLTELV